jgi:hypothetical protein
MSDAFARGLRAGAHLALHPEEEGRDRPWDRDPVAWVEHAGVLIESKTHGLVPFKPYPFQANTMRMVAAGVSAIVPKSRQIGITTAVGVALAHQLLYRQQTGGPPLHAHLVANKEEVAVESVLKKVRTALNAPGLTPVQKSLLSGIDPASKAPLVTYDTPEAQNYIRAHASAADVGRSFAGNVAIMEEVAFCPFVRATYNGLRNMVGEISGAQRTGQMWLISTLNGDGDFFTEMWDDAVARGFVEIPLDWRCHPDRDEAWKLRDRASFAGHEWEWDQEHELQRFLAGQQAVNLALVKRLADRTEWVGPTPNPAHRYSKGVDLSGRGGDSTVYCVVDTLLRPAQGVWIEEQPRQSTPDSLASIEALDDRWPGPLFVDGTNDPSRVNLIQARDKWGVHFSGGAQTVLSVDAENAVRWRKEPRSTMESSLASNLETGRLLFHEEPFPKLRAALQAWRRNEQKRDRGRHIDHLDALLLANLALTRAGVGGDNAVFAELPGRQGIRGGRAISGLRRTRW